MRLLWAGLLFYVNSTPKKKQITLEASIVTVCVDLSKNTFHVVGLDSDGKKILRRKFNREAFKSWLARPELPRAIVAMEACGGAQWWGAYCQTLGHTPRMIPPHHVRPFATSQKNDFNVRREKSLAGAVL
jgi:transposase